MAAEKDTTEFRPMTTQEAHEFVKAGGNPLDTTPARQREMHRTHLIATGQIPAPAPVGAPMGSINNPIKGPEHPGFDGPQVNHSKPPSASAQEPELGSRGRPIVGAPIGTSPGVRNVSESMAASRFRGPEAQVFVTEGQENEHRRQLAEREQQKPPVDHQTPATYVGLDGTRKTVVRKEGEDNVMAIRRMRSEEQAEQERAAGASGASGASGGTGATGASGSSNANEGTPGSTGTTGATGASSEAGSSGASGAAQEGGPHGAIASATPPSGGTP